MPFETKVDYNVKFDVIVLFINDYPIKHRTIIYVLGDYYKKHKKIFNKHGCTKEREYKGCNFVNVNGDIHVIKDKSSVTVGKFLFGRKVVSCCKLKKKEIVC